MDFQSLASNAGIDVEDFIEIAQLLIDTSISDMNKIRQGIESNNTEMVAMAAHSIKGASGNMGFSEIFQTAAQIEMSAKSENLEGITEKVTLIEQRLGSLANELSVFNNS